MVNSWEETDFVRVKEEFESLESWDRVDWRFASGSWVDWVFWRDKGWFGSSSSEKSPEGGGGLGFEEGNFKLPWARGGGAGLLDGNFREPWGRGGGGSIGFFLEVLNGV